MGHGRAQKGSVFVAAALLCAASTVRAEDDSAKLREARALFDLGVETARQERWAEAERLFARADTLIPRPSNAYNRALALYRLSRLREMVAELDRFLARSDPTRDAEDRAVAVRLRAEGQSRLATVHVAVSPQNATVHLDSENVPVDRGDAVVSVDPGTHALSAEESGFASARRQLSLSPGERLDVLLVLTPFAPVPPIEASRPPSGALTTSLPSTTSDGAGIPAGAIALAGAGAASLIAAAVTGIMASNLDSHVASRCTAKGCPDDLRDEQDRVWRLAVASDVLLGSGVVLAGSGLTWFLASRHSNTSPRASIGPRWASLDVPF